MSNIVSGVTFISEKISAAKNNRNKDDTINALEEIIKELFESNHELSISLIEAKNKLELKNVSEEEFKELNYMFLALIELSSEEENKEKIRAASEILNYRNLLALQTLGFSYKEAIGEPLTRAVAEYITEATRKTARNNKRRR